MIRLSMKTRLAIYLDKTHTASFASLAIGRVKRRGKRRIESRSDALSDYGIETAFLNFA